MIETKEFMDNLSQWSDICLSDERIDLELYEKYDVKRGLRDKNGNGVVAGLTKVSKIEANKVVDGVKVPCEGKLFYRGYNIYDLIGGVVRENRYGFEEIAYLLLFGELPNADQLTKFKESLAFSRTLPTNFVRDVVMKAPTKDMMISLSKSILTLASYDEKGSTYLELSKKEKVDTIAAIDPLHMAETYDDISKRSIEVMDTIVKATQEAGGGNALAVSSGDEIATILDLLVPEQYQGERIANCSVTVLTYKDGLYELKACGDVSYMQAGEERNK